MEERYDLILDRGTIVDGSGAPAFTGGLGIVGDRIAYVGDLSKARATERIDTSGLIIAPGFIDTHTHDDTALLEQPGMPMKVSQGVTTVVAGNCGISIAPAAFDGEPVPPLDLIGSGSAYRFPKLDAYLSELERKPPAVNTIMLVGHSSLRASAMDRLDRPAEAGELEAMTAMLAESMDAGAVGLSTGLAYRPANAASREEISALAEVAARRGGLYATHMRDEADDVVPSLEEALATAHEARVPLIVSHHKIVGRNNHGSSSETLRRLESARRVQPLAIDAYPYAASSTVLKEDRVRQSSKVLVTWSRSLPEARGKELSIIARELGCSELEAVERLQPAGAIYFVLDEEDVRRIVSWTGTMIGSDGLPQDEYPHPRLWGTFARVLGHYCRDVGLFPLEEAVRKMTWLPADVFGLEDRGRIEAGAYADLVVFDRDAVADRATFLEPTQVTAGLELVLVNGSIVWQAGRMTGNRPGRVLRRQQLGRPMREQAEALGWRGWEPA